VYYTQVNTVIAVYSENHTKLINTLFGQSASPLSSVPFTRHWGHRARVKVHHLVLFVAEAFTSAQLFLSDLGKMQSLIIKAVGICSYYWAQRVNEQLI
jgi:hypothetical protein